MKSNKGDVTYKNVPDMLDAAGINLPGIIKAIESRKISCDMLIERARANLTQEELATKLGVSVDWVDRIENTDDIYLTLGEIEKYYNGLGKDVAFNILPL